MNVVLHNIPSGEIHSDNTFSDPWYKDDNDDSKLRKFDYIVANPPFSMKNWMDGLKPYGRFDDYDELPPEKNGDYAWLLHIIKSMKNNTGKAAVILPHGVLFRGNAEESIRKNIIDRHLIKGIIGLPANLFYGTGIPACIIVLDKENTASRTGIFMIDASHGFIKDGDKNRLREQDIYKIVTTFNSMTEVPGFSRFVPFAEIIEKNAYGIDTDRIYIGGDSNGGFMTMRMILDYPEFFAAAFPICEALLDARISDEDIRNIRDLPIWFTHAKDDPVVPPKKYVVPTYERLIAAGAKNVHFTFWDGIYDMHGQFLDEKGNPWHYLGHFAWIPVFNDDCRLDYDGKPVTVEGREVTLFDWLALQKRA